MCSRPGRYQSAVSFSRDIRRFHSSAIAAILRPCTLHTGQGMRSLQDFATAKLAELDRTNLHRALADTTRLDGIFALRNGRRLLSFCCNDYLNLSHHPAIKAAAAEALAR